MNGRRFVLSVGRLIDVCLTALVVYKFFCCVLTLPVYVCHDSPLALGVIFCKNLI